MAFAEVPSDHIRIYMAFADVLEDPEVIGRLYRRLPGFRKRRADSFKSAEVRNQSTAVFGLLMCGLGELVIPDGKETGRPDDEPFSEEDWRTLDHRIDENGKPYFAGRGDIHFSMSHTRGAVMCVISGSEVGCDIERSDRRLRPETVATRIFQDHDPPPDIGPGEFLRIWTGKEAYSKYTGEGLKQIVDRRIPDDPEVTTLTGEANGYIWSVVSGPGAVPDEGAVRIISAADVFGYDSR